MSWKGAINPGITTWIVPAMSYEALVSEANKKRLSEGLKYKGEGRVGNGRV